MRGMYRQPTFARPSSFQMPSTFARSSDKLKIMEDYGLSYWFQRRIPRPENAKRFKWSPGAMIANLPSVIQTGAGASGATRGLLPQLLRPKRHASSIAGESTFALDSEYGGQAQSPLAEQPQRTKEQPYFGKFLGQVVRSLKDRVTSSTPARPYEEWTGGYVGEDTELVTVDSGELEMARRRKERGPLAPPVMMQRMLPTLGELRTRLRRA